MSYEYPESACDYAQADTFWNFFITMIADLGEKTSIARQEYIPGLKTLVHLLEESASCRTGSSLPLNSDERESIIRDTGREISAGKISGTEILVGIDSGRASLNPYLLHGAKSEKKFMGRTRIRYFEESVTDGDVSLPDKYTLYDKHWIAPPKMQGFCNTCVAFAVTAAIEARMQIINNKPWTESQYRYSEQFLFFHSIRTDTHPIEVIEGEINKKVTQGWYITTALVFCEKTGFISERDLFYNPYNRLSMPPLAKQKYNTIGRIDDWNSYPWTKGSRDHIKKFLCSNNGGLIFSFSFRPDFFVYSNGVYPYLEDYRYTQDAGHAVLCIGYDDKKQAWHCKNSWGTNWGEEGFFWLDYNYPVIDELAFCISLKNCY